MNKSELIDQIAKDASITKVQANASLDIFTNAIVSTLKKGETVTLVGFGTFSVSQRAARNGRNPQTPGLSTLMKQYKVVLASASRHYQASSSNFD